MNEIDVKKYQDLLEAERKQLEEELATVGRQNPDNPADWEPVPGDVSQKETDPNEIADGIEEFETNTAILKQLEIRLNEVKEALERIKDGGFGKCETCGNPIEISRLDANGAAKTCVSHLND